MTSVPPNPDKSFTDGFNDGYHSIRPGILPAIPSHAIPAGYTPYQWGYEKGREKAEGNG